MRSNAPSILALRVDGGQSNLQPRIRVQMRASAARLFNSESNVETEGNGADVSKKHRPR